jgi:hypothetical protein
MTSEVAARDSSIHVGALPVQLILCQLPLNLLHPLPCALLAAQQTSSLCGLLPRLS